MASDNVSASRAGWLVAPSALRTKARLHAPPTVIELLGELAIQARIAVCIDVDAFARTSLGQADRVMLCALDALCRMGAQIVLLARHQRARAALWHDGLPMSWCLDHGEPAPTLGHVRARLPDVPLVVISDDPDLLSDLVERDRGIAVGAPLPARSHIAVATDPQVRAALWWLVDARWKAGLVAGI
jgi:hypothetical protein